MNFFDFVKLAKVYSNMGSSVQSQMDDVIAGVPLETLNPNALKMIRDLVGKLEDRGVEDALDIVGDIDDHLGD